MEQPRKIQWILCDLGKTLVNFDHEKIGNSLLKVIREQHPDTCVDSGNELVPPVNALSLYAWFFLQEINGSNRNTEIDTGRLSIEQLWQDFMSEFSVSIPFEDFDRIWYDIFDQQFDEVIRAMNSAQNQGIKVAICSSTNSSHWNHVLEKYPEIEALSRKAFLTFEMGMMKTDEGFFPSILKDLECEGSEVLFIDDRIDNLESAKRSRIHGLLFDGHLPDWSIFSV